MSHFVPEVYTIRIIRGCCRGYSSISASFFESSPPRRFFAMMMPSGEIRKFAGIDVIP